MGSLSCHQLQPFGPEGVDRTGEEGGPGAARQWAEAALSCQGLHLRPPVPGGRSDPQSPEVLFVPRGTSSLGVVALAVLRLLK